MKLSIVVPVFQNSTSLPTTIPALLELQKSIPLERLEIIFVDDGSTDGSYEILRAAREHNPSSIKLLRFARNFGQIPAIQAGLREATGDCAGIISADMQDPPQMFLEMLQHWRDGKMVVMAERESRPEGPIQSFISNLFWRLVSKFAVKNYPKNGFDCCLIDRRVVDLLNTFHEKNTHIFPLIFSFGFPYAIVRYSRQERLGGRSQWTLAKKMKLFIDTFTAFSYLPIRFISLIGLVVSSLSITYGILISALYLIYGNSFAGWTTLAVISSTLSGLILFTLGIIGEYLWRILDATRARPDYVILERLIESGDEPKLTLQLDNHPN